MSNHEKKLKIIFSTTRQWNPGDEFILKGVLNIFVEAGIEFIPIIYNRNPDIRAARQNNFRALPLTQKNEMALDQKLESLFKIGMYDNSVKPDSDLSYADLVVFAGTPEWCNNERLEDLYQSIYRYNIPTIYIGIGAPAIFAHEYYKEICIKAALITVRQKSLVDKINTEIKCLHPPIYLPCPSILSSPVEIEKTIKTVKCIGLIYQGSKDEINYMSGIPQSLYIKQIDLFHNIIDRYKNQFETKIICHYIDEIPLAVRDFPDTELCYSYDSSDYYDIYSHCDVVIGSRVHGIGIAAALNIPGIAVSYDLRGDTCEGFLAEIIGGNDFPDMEECLRRVQALIDEAPQRSKKIQENRQKAKDEYVLYVKNATTECLKKHPIYSKYNPSHQYEIKDMNDYDEEKILHAVGAVSLTKYSSIETALQDTQRWLRERDNTLAEIEKKYKKTDAALKDTQDWLKERDVALSEAEEKYKATDIALKETQGWLKERDNALSEAEEKYKATDIALKETQGWLKERDNALSEAEEKYKATDIALKETQGWLKERDNALSEAEEKYKATDIALKETQGWLKERDAVLTETKEKYIVSDAALKRAQEELKNKELLLAETEVQYKETESLLHETQEQLFLIEKQLKKKCDEYDAVISSFSWKLTKPFRKIGKMIKKK